VVKVQPKAAVKLEDRKRRDGKLILRVGKRREKKRDYAKHQAEGAADESAQ
jgi:hypothetical protein